MQNLSNRPTIRKKTSQIKVGDVLKVWWAPNYDTVVSLRKYDGPLLNILGKGTKLADFAQNKVGMTLEAGGVWDVVKVSR